jgi:hypothetical protein
MPHYPKPFFKKGRGLWYVEINRQQFNLGPDEAAAQLRYHELMLSQPKPVNSTTAHGIVQAFFDWVQLNTSPRTVEWYERHLNTFLAETSATLSVSELKPNHVTKILGQHPKWSSSTKHGFCRAAQRAFRWAEDEELIARSPLRSSRNPKPNAARSSSPTLSLRRCSTIFKATLFAIC